MKPIRILFVAIVLTSALGSSVSAQGDTFVCEGALPPRLDVYDGGSVVSSRLSHLRATPSMDGELLAIGDGGTTFSVLDGPVCSEGLVWWRISFWSESDGEIRRGWAIESFYGRYLLQPRLQNITPILTEDSDSLTITASTDLMTASVTVPSDIIGGTPVVLELFPFYDPLNPILFDRAAGIQIQLPEFNGTNDWASLYIFDISTVEEAGPNFSETSVAIQDFLKSPPPVDAFLDRGSNITLPTLPPLSLQQAMTALPQMLDIEGQTGFRAITSYSQEATLLNDVVAYEFIGLDDNGQRLFAFYAPAIAPVFNEIHDSIPNILALRPAELEEYFLEGVARLNQAPENVQPSLDVLDAIVQSITVSNPE